MKHQLMLFRFTVCFTKTSIEPHPIERVLITRRSVLLLETGIIVGLLLLAGLRPIGVDTK